jgi:hypothetical protein
MKRHWGWLLALGGLSGAGMGNDALASAVGEIAAHKHMGVATCSNSVCHGATEVSAKARIQMNEFAVWQEFDPHAKSYRTLLSAESQAIAKKLGVGAAEQAQVCLDCHADNPPAAMRGEKFQISDGVGCEACHGGAEPWIATHVDSRPRATISPRACIPTEDPVRRGVVPELPHGVRAIA